MLGERPPPVKGFGPFVACRATPAPLSLPRRPGAAQDWAVMFKPIAIVLAVLASLAGCATVIDERMPAPDGWPTLEAHTVFLGPIALEKKCWKYQPLYMKLLGGLVIQCVEANFEELTCTQYRPRDETDGDAHEAAHCDGRDHVGESTMRDAWTAWVRSKGEAACASYGGLRATVVDWSAAEPYSFSCREGVTLTRTHEQVRGRRS